MQLHYGFDEMKFQATVKKMRAGCEATNTLAQLQMCRSSSWALVDGATCTADHAIHISFHCDSLTQILSFIIILIADCIRYQDRKDTNWPEQ